MTLYRHIYTTRKRPHGCVHGYVPGTGGLVFGSAGPGNRDAAVVRQYCERRPQSKSNQGGWQVVQDLNLDHRFSRTLLARKASRVLRFQHFTHFPTAASSPLQTTKHQTDRTSLLIHHVGDKNPAASSN